MTEPLDPRALRWVEAGVSGLARSRDWDHVELVSVPELANDSLEELRFSVLADGTAVGATPPGSDPELLDRLAGRLGEALTRPFEAVAARRTRLEWSLAGRLLRLEELALPPLAADELVVALGPGDERPTVLVDGEEPAEPSAELAEAVVRLAELGGRRFESYVARARRLEPDRWAVSVDPL